MPEVRQLRENGTHARMQSQLLRLRRTKFGLILGGLRT
jgi:hypothetical protein